MKWNDFQSRVSHSFGLLRREEDFFDVTLVSEDENQVQAHKLVLSACSDFFRSILRKNPHSNPLIFLTGVSSSNLELVLDYIYQGEVKIFQDQLDSFLNVAQKLRIEGLNAGNNAEEGNNIPETDDVKFQDNKNTADLEFPSKQREMVNYEYEEKRSVKTVAVDQNFDESQIQTKILELIEERNGKKHCKVCGYNSKELKRHVEVHIEGLSYSCHPCGKTFRSKNSLTFHKYKKCRFS